jgi:hypothetical protein
LNVGERLDKQYRPIGPNVRAEVDGADYRDLHLGINETAQIACSRGQAANEYSQSFATGHYPQNCVIPFGMFRTYYPRDRDTEIRVPARGQFAAGGWNGVRQVVVTQQTRVVCMKYAVGMGSTGQLDPLAGAQFAGLDGDPGQQSVAAVLNANSPSSRVEMGDDTSNANRPWMHSRAVARNVADSCYGRGAVRKYAAPPSQQQGNGCEWSHER